MRRIFILGFLLLASAPALAEAPRFVLAERIAGPDGGWDFAAVDPQQNRLFVARANGVTAVDLATKKVTDLLVEGAGVHGVLPLQNSAFAISTNGKSANAFLFDKASGKMEAVFPTGQSPDALLVEPKTGLVVIFNGKSHDATLVDVAAKKIVGTVAVGGKPEVGAADGTGRVFVNLEDKAEVAVIDVPAGKVVASHKLEGCEAPTGLALDSATGVLISACDNKVAKILDAATGRDLATLPIGKGPDGVLLDETRRRAFIPAGDGTLTVLSLAASKDIAVVATVETARGAKTGAVDPATGNVYLPTAGFAPPEKEGARPKPVPGTFNILVVSEQH
jgi:DNA-binding beta-propeller fold protein YncE